MRILVCSSEVPLPPVNGFRLHLSALLDELEKRHELDVLGLRMPDQALPTDAGGIRGVPMWNAGSIRRARSVILSLVLRQPLGVDQRAAALRGPLHEELERFQPDVVHVSSGKLASLGRDLAGRATVLVALDAWHLNEEAKAALASGLERRLIRSNVARIRRFESVSYRRFCRIVVVSDQDREALQALDAGLRVAVVPNGVDCDTFKPDGSVAMDPDRILFTGVMSYPPNVTAAEFLARQVLPRVRRMHPAAHLAIVGRSPRPEVKALASLEGVEVIGEVPAVGPWLSGSRAYACPMLTGTGIKNKLLEALATGAACVASPLALQGLSVTPGRELLVGSGATETATALVSVLTDDALARSLGRAGREYAVSHHSWRAVADAYERVYREAVSDIHR